MKIGFIGLGSMGSQMARRLVGAGHDVHVWNRSPQPRQRAAQDGAIACESAAEVFETGVVFSILANDAAADAVFSADLLAGVPPHAVHVSMSSLSMEMADVLARRHAEAGVTFISSPVLGRPEKAAAGTLNILAAGDQAAVERLAPCYDAMGERTWFIEGEPSRANAVKICVNYNLLHTLQALGESCSIAESLGIDAPRFVEILTSSLYSGVAYTGYGNLIANREYRPAGFSLALGLKDLTLAEKAAAEGGVQIPSAAVIRDSLERSLQNPDLADADWSSMAETIRAMKA
ncbi:MAG: NAD(P)-dependent oxidoreductase [Beutenbergiaceae bacterium]